MADILADYREWRSKQEDRIGTHSDRCHMWQRHERCMIHRLAAALAAEMAKRTPAEPSTPGEGKRQAGCIVTRLRQTRSDMLGTDDEPHYWDCQDAAAEIERLRLAIRRLAEQDATLSVQGGHVTVTMDATLTEAERFVLREVIDIYAGEDDVASNEIAAVIDGLLERTK